MDKKALLTKKMIDLGHTLGTGCPVMSSKSEKNKKFYPSFYLNGKEAEFLKGADVGAKRRYVVETILKSKTLSESDGRDGWFEASLEVQKIGEI